ncbi:sel1 repeat family protein [Paraburkholderia fungorum]|uniref:TPR repeat protein n=1 Tax=Paraburkholderia fungorum TaxID=134537 RepID=A0AAW3V1N9_9BURK|nr:sel1 repeat family protein [Paraburkholderia fungorum]MBB4515143.1 TPR repeat protein [Paraburkholderia fungorum]MBB6203086.1 TPR repeat protein [Paraburkholderia fungorum]
MRPFARLLARSIATPFLKRAITALLTATAWRMAAAVAAAATVSVVSVLAAEPQVACPLGYPVAPPAHVQKKTPETSHRLPLARMDDPRCAGQPSATLDRLAAYHCAQLYDAAGRLEEALGWYGVAAVAGYGPAQKRLGNLYGGEGDVARDYACAVYWQRRARESGESIDLPHVFMGGTPP